MKQTGFTLIELLVFIVVTSLLMSVLLLGANVSMRAAPSINQQTVALQSARRCLEWYLDQTRFYGYSKYTCPSTPTATACTVPSGYTVTTNVSCTTWNSDTNYKTITVTIGGLASATEAVTIGDY